MTAIFIDDLFPVTKSGKPAYTRSADHELWVMIMEKIWAKAYKSYENIEAGLAKFPPFLIKLGKSCTHSQVARR